MTSSSHGVAELDQTAEMPHETVHDDAVGALIDQYLAAWNETDPQARREAIGALWAADGVYTDPLASVSGVDGIDRVIAGAQEQFAGLWFVRGTVLDAHHNIARFTWELVTEAGAEPLVVGFDVAVVNDDEKITAVYGFIDKMPT
ncbi:nuclear transport factor 2 family protein [Gordonia rubripertincta]|uniref:Nuclear transport factor 2 family protein n=1 Tax=Gordonia rubripertincta TaxID=36822 RepID=A0ABT4MVR9_GORRU|nr:nuclear transport factor 2 family protein [Gordonia rubripertincta]MCZ4549847.1 nuclear transport factor 2 family protein [Gordonia rubripertincta]